MIEVVLVMIVHEHELTPEYPGSCKKPEESVKVCSHAGNKIFTMG